MKLIGPTSKPVQKNPIQKYLDQIKQWLPIGKVKGDEDTVLEHLGRGLDNRFILLHHLQLESLGPTFPPILIGPPGLAVLNISQEGGFFKAKDNNWLKLDKASQNYNPSRPNLIKQTQEYARKLGTILDVNGKSHPEVMPLLVLANPGVHLETSNPAIRIVLTDGIDKLTGALQKSEDVLSLNEITYLSDSLEVISNPENALIMGEGEDFFGRDLLIKEKKAPVKLPPIPIPTDIPLEPVEKELKFSNKQWLILTVLLLATIVILVGAIIYVIIAY
jgi:hypothetical protein